MTSHVFARKNGSIQSPDQIVRVEHHGPHALLPKRPNYRTDKYQLYMGYYCVVLDV